MIIFYCFAEFPKFFYCEAVIEKPRRNEIINPPPCPKNAEREGDICPRILPFFIQFPKERYVLNPRRALVCCVGVPPKRIPGPIPPPPETEREGESYLIETKADGKKSRIEGTNSKLAPAEKKSYSIIPREMENVASAFFVFCISPCVKAIPPDQSRKNLKEIICERRRK